MNNQVLTYGRVLVLLFLHVLFFQHAAFASGWWFVGLHLLAAAHAFAIFTAAIVGGRVWLQC